MGTKKEQTLQIKDFRGVNRFNDGTITQPNEFYTIQNMHPVNRAEIASIGGVVDQTPDSMPGVGSILHTAFLEQGFGEKFYLAFFNFNGTVAVPSISASNLSTSGGTATTHYVKILYIGPGGAFNEVRLSGTSIQANGLTVTLPLDVPDYVFQINIYISASGGGLTSIAALCGSMHRRNGVFASSITVPKPVFATTPATVPDVQPTSFVATGTTGGSLVANRTYYVAIAPFVAASSPYQVSGGGGRDTRAYLTTTASVTSFMTFQLGVGETAAILTFNFAASPAVAAGTNVTRWCVFIGTTPEDMMAISDTTDGTVVSITDAIIRGGTFTVKEIPYNSCLGIWMDGTGNRNVGSVTAGVEAAPSSSSSRNFGHYRALSWFGLSASGAGSDINEGIDYGPGSGSTLDSNPSSGVTGVWVTKQLPWSASTAYQIAPNINEKSRSVKGGLFRDVNPTLASLSAYNPSFFWNVTGYNIYSVPLGDRLYCANGQNTVFYTNGYVFRPIVKDNGGSPIPITTFIESVRDRLVCAGGPDNFANTSHQVFYSEINDPFNFGAAPVWNNFRVWSKDEINGLGIFSQNLDTSGPNSFLVVSKKDDLFTWNGLTGSSQIVSELNYKLGFAGPRAFVKTKLGPVFVGQDNIYVLKSSDSILPFGYEFKDVISALTDTQKTLINCVFHDDKVKIAYPSSGTDLDREIWLELRLEDGAIQKYYSGPHALLAFNSQAVASAFGSANNVRLSTLNSKVYQRDSGTLNNGSAIARKIVINRLGLQQDHFLKVMTRIYMALKIGQDETFTLTFDQEDGTTQTIKTTAALVATAARQLLQAHVVDRVLGRVNSLTIDNSSTMALSIYDISMLYNILRRRQLR